MSISLIMRYSVIQTIHEFEIPAQTQVWKVHNNKNIKFLLFFFFPWPSRYSISYSTYLKFLLYFTLLSQFFPLQCVADSTVPRVRMTYFLWLLCLGGCWFVAYIRRFIYKIVKCMFFWLHSCCGKWEGWARKLVYHTSWVAVVIPTDRPRSVRNRCVIEYFVALFVLSLCPFDISVGVGASVIGLSQISFFFVLIVFHNHRGIPLSAPQLQCISLISIMFYIIVTVILFVVWSW